MSASPETAYMGLDLGGTGAKAGVFDLEGHMLGFERRPWADRPPGGDRAEVPIERIYAAAREAAASAVRQSGARVRAVAVVSQGQSFVSLDERDRPLHDAILWYDSRAGEEAGRLRSALLAAGKAELAAGIGAIATAPKIMWLRARHPELMARARRHLLLPDYMAYRLTGRAVSDPWTAASTGLLAPGGLRYDPDALAAAGIEAEKLAHIQPAGTPIGPVSAGAARQWGLEPGTALVTGTNDQYAGALGAGNCRPGIVSVTTGTCLALVSLAERPPKGPRPGLFVGPFPIEPYRYVLAYAKTAGLALDWFRSAFCPELSLEELEAMAACVPAGSNGLCVLPHLAGMVSPEPMPQMRGAITGLSLDHGRAELYRAMLEALAFSLRENLELMRAAGLETELIRSVGGAARSDLWAQMQADVAGLPVERPEVTEAAALGGAMLAAAACGEFANLIECCEALYRPAALFRPNRERQALYEEPYARYRALRKRLYG